MISFIITSYNYGVYIRECIESCLLQSGAFPIEVLVVDDGSTDETKEILSLYKGRVRCFFLQNSGVEKAANIGIRNANGRFIVRVDADDRLHPKYLAELSPHLGDSSDWTFVYPEYFYLSAEGIVGDWFKLPDFNKHEIRARGDFLATGTVFRKSALQEVEMYNEDVKNSGLENYELILRLLENNMLGKCVHEPLFYYRLHNKNMSKNRRSSIISYGNKLARNFHLKAYQTNEYHPYSLKLED